MVSTTQTNGHHSENNVVLITGAAGWLGGVLAGELLKDPLTPNVKLILCDIVEPKAPKGAQHALTFKADLCDEAEIKKLFTTEFGIPDTIYCFHGIMSRGAEDNFDLGMKVNIDSIRMMLEAARHSGAPQPIKFCFSSSIAVFGGPVTKEVITPDTTTVPEGSYGCGKLVGEILVNEYSRRGFVDGRVFRLPTVVVRPGVPSAATSAFISGIIREPVKGVKAICPVGDSIDSPELDQLSAWLATPETTVANFIVAKHVPASKFRSHSRVVSLPGFTASVRDEINALREVMGEETVKLIEFKNDPTNARIVGSWPARFDNTYALSLGFKVDQNGMVDAVKSFKAMVDAGLA